MSGRRRKSSARAINSLGQIAGFAVTAAAGFVAVAGGVAMLGSVVVDTLKGAFDGLVSFFGERIFAITDWFANLGATFEAEGHGFFWKAWRKFRTFHISSKIEESTTRFQ